MKVCVDRDAPGVSDELRKGAPETCGVESHRRDAQLRQLVEGSSDIIFETDPEGLFVFMNQAAYPCLGYHPHQLIGRHFTSIIHPDWREIVLQHYVSQRKRLEATTYLEFQCLAADGRAVWLGQHVKAVVRDRKVVAFHSIARDVTELRTALAAARAGEERFAAFMRNSPVVAHIKEEDGRLVAVSDSFAQLHARTSATMVGMRDSDLYEIPPATRATEALVLRSGQAVRNMESRTYPDGALHHWLVHRFPVPAIGQSVQMGTIAVEVTDRVTLENELAGARDAALESAKQKSAFLANMSHELRTPMNGVLGMLGCLLDTELTADQQDLAETARFSAESLLTLLNDILDFSKIEAGKLTLEVLDFEVPTMMESVIDLLAATARKKSLEIGCALDGDVPTLVRGDAGRVRQILMNLIGNAIKFTDHGGVVVRATREDHESDSAVIRFSVTDSGIGISEDSMKLLFQPFAQADSSTTRRFGGTGLGLAISRQLVELMGGQIGVHSTPGEGSTFWFTARFENSHRSVAQSPARHLPRVLIVDDSATARSIMSLRMVAWGLSSEAVAGAHAALSRIRSASVEGAPFDVVISDLEMDDMDGLALARIIKAQTQLPPMRFLIVSGSAPTESPASLESKGIDLWLTKPLKQERLQAAVFGEADVRAVTPRAPSKPAAKARTARILVAEDNSVNQKVVLRMLGKLGYKADVVANGLEVLDAIQRTTYHLILMDCMMPEMDGYEATRHIRSAYGPAMPIIALTANALAGDRERCIKAGMDDFLTKPLREADLDGLLCKWMSEDPVENAEVANIVSVAEVQESFIDAGAFAALISLADGDQEFLQELITMYVDQSKELLDSADEAGRSGDNAGFTIAVHTLNGSSRNVGAMRLALLCATAETEARAHPERDVTSVVTALRGAHKNTCGALERELSAASRLN